MNNGDDFAFVGRKPILVDGGLIGGTFSVGAGRFQPNQLEIYMTIYLTVVVSKVMIMTVVKNIVTFLFLLLSSSVCPRLRQTRL